MNDNQGIDNQGIDKDKEYQSFAIKRGLLAVVLIVALVWGLAVGLSYIDTPQRFHQRETSPSATGENQTEVEGSGQHQPAKTAAQDQDTAEDNTGGAQTHAAADKAVAESGGHAAATLPSGEVSGLAAEARAKVKETGPAHDQPAETPESPASKSAQTQEKTEQHAGEQAAAPEHPAAPEQIDLPSGVTFVNSVMEPIEYELKKRFWGWRPNDLLNFTDNANNFQLGVLEVTRRAVVQLAERISRTGSTDSFNPHLENSMNWLMVTATRYWFPSPESKYMESLDELTTYRDQLMKRQASFYTRTDNLIPLLAAFEDLLGSCDENLVKYKEEDGEQVSYFKVDDYFYYAKGVASAMATILEAIHHDFEQTLEGRHATELLHHALASCQRAAALDPWIITDGNLDGVLANHRANIAAPISHARFFMGQLVKTLST